MVAEVLDEDIVTVKVGDSETYVRCSVMLLPEPPKTGDFLLVHAGFAINTIEPEEARKTLDLLREMTELAGQAPLSNTAFDLS
jgi:hydrogenase expression/formation protein HypC